MFFGVLHKSGNHELFNKLQKLEFSSIYFKKLHNVNQRFQSSEVSITDFYSGFIDEDIKILLPSFFGEKIRYTENSAHIGFDIRNDVLLQSNCSFFEEISEDCASIIIKGLI
jgi:hypothetical protein